MLTCVGVSVIPPDVGGSLQVVVAQRRRWSQCGLVVVLDVIGVGFLWLGYVVGWLLLAVDGGWLG